MSFGQPAIAASGLVKRFGSTVALDGIDLQVPSGTVYGFIGPNGAGKTTALRIIAGLLNASAGSASVFGMDVRRQRRAVQAEIGFLPGEVRLYGEATGRENLRLLAAMHDMAPRRRADLLDRFELSAKELDRKVRTYSRGMQQKLGIVAALQHDAPLLVLDEPTEGLDPLMQAAFVELVDEEAGNGKTVLLSSHALSEVERTCDRMTMVRGGTIIFEGTLADVRSRALRRLDVVFGEPVELPWREMANVVDVEGTTRHHVVTFTGNPNALLRLVVDLPVEDLSLAVASLEESFLSYYREGPS
ncbi:MAG: ABC transporter ATP-binding protein [Actinomycetota bacterium]